MPMFESGLGHNRIAYLLFKVPEGWGEGTEEAGGRRWND
jgi:hypothetical protein